MGCDLYIAGGCDGRGCTLLHIDLASVRSQMCGLRSPLLILKKQTYPLLPVTIFGLYAMRILLLLLMLSPVAALPASLACSRKIVVGHPVMGNMFMMDTTMSLGLQVSSESKSFWKTVWINFEMK